MTTFYDKYILPRCLNCLCSVKPITYQREKVVPLASGVVLEVGVGSGLNFQFYDNQKVERVIGLDPSVELNFMAQKVADEQRLRVDFMIGYGEKIDLPSDSADTVLVTYTLCSVEDVLLVCSEILRVLKPGGKLIFCEHGLAPDDSVARWQRRIDPFWGVIAGGCHLDRDIPGLISTAGFEIETLDQMYLPSTPRFAGFNSWGTAKPNA